VELVEEVVEGLPVLFGTVELRQHPGQIGHAPSLESPLP
jgi:hypothetical protein